MALPVSNLVRVTVNLSPLAAAVRSFGILMIAGDSNVINGNERFRTYSGIDEVAADFGTTAPEYLAALLYFGQSPKPRTLMIGRWLRTASSGFNKGGILTPTQQSLSNWTVITNGGFHISVDGGGSANVTGLNFSGASNLNGVATLITAGLTGAVCTWNGSQFIITSTSTGASSAISYLTAPVSGTDISAQLKMTSSTNVALIPGYVAETPVACAAALADKSTIWYGLMFAAATMPTDDQSIDVSSFIEALDVKRIYGVTTQNTGVLSAEVSSDLASRQKAAGYLRSFIQYSSSSAYAIAAFIGRAFSVNFNAQNSTITLMYKQEPGVTFETLTSSQAAVLLDKRCNVFVEYDNDTAIIQYGQMSGSAWFDEIHGLDWLQNAIQTACYNLLYQSPTKIPQTDSGANQFVNAISGVCQSAVDNGLVAPGVWNSSATFGQLTTGQYLKAGYYIYAQPMALQAQSDRESRVAPPISVAVKLAGAIQELDVIVDVNR